MDIPKLAAKIADFLPQFLPYLILATEAAAKEAGKRFGEAAWNKAQVLWEKLKPKVEGKPSAQKTIENVRVNEIKKTEGKPENPQAELRLKVLLETLMEDDAEFLNFVKAEDYSLAVGGDINNSNVAVGENAQAANTINNNNYYTTTDDKDEKSRDAKSKYLRSLRASCYSLPLTTLGDNKSLAEIITLEKVYINLEVEKTNQEKMERENGEEKDQTPLTCMDVASTEKRLVLLGNAGSGKSSFVKHLIAQQASVLLNEKTALAGFASDLIPVYIELRRLSPLLQNVNIAKATRQDKLKKLSDIIFKYIQKELEERDVLNFLPALESAFGNGNILLVLDGLDEVPPSLREVIRQTVEAIIQLQKIEKIIITSRLNAYTTGESKFHNFVDYKIALLDEDKIQAFAKDWYESQTKVVGGKLTPEQAEEKSNDLAYRAINTIPNEMSGNPMMLTCIAIIHKDGREFPKHRAMLYRQLIELFSGKWQEEEKEGNQIDSNDELNTLLSDKQRLRNIIACLAFETHRLNAEAGKNKENADITLGQAMDVLNRLKPFDNNRGLTGKFLDYIYINSGLFYSDGGENPTYRFPHRELQEYLTGCYLTDQEDYYKEYQKYAAQGDYWTSPVLLGAEHILYNQEAWQKLLPAISELCPATPPETEQEERAILWSGQIAVEWSIEKIIEKSPTNGKEFLKRLVDNSLYLLEKSKFISPRERAEAGNTLAQLGDPRIGVIPHPHPQPLSQERERGVNLLFCEIRAGEFWMGSKDDDKYAGDDEKPQFKYSIPYKYFMSRYPVTNAQFEAFVKAEDGYTQAKWWTEAGLNWRDENKRTDHYRYGGVFDLANHPVVGVTWYEAIAFCKWLTVQYQETSEEIRVYDPDTKTIQAHENLKSKIVNRKMEIRLPSEAEWEYAARGNLPLSHLGEGLGVRVFPWKSNDITPNHANYSETNLNATSAVGAFPLGMNDFGLLDMSGNVWEWCATEWQADYKEYLKKENNEVEGRVARVLRGGSYFDEDWDVRCAWRDRRNPNYEFNLIGFRVVCVSSPISP